jgi:hypothetical protein
VGRKVSIAPKGMRAGSLGTAGLVLTLVLASSQPAAAVVSSDTLAAADCNSTAHQETTEQYEDGSSNPHEPEDWPVTREFELAASGERNDRRLNLDFYGYDERGNPEPAVARNFFYNQGEGEDGEEGYLATRETTVVGESSAEVRVLRGDRKPPIELGVFKPDWESEEGDNVVGRGFGAGIGSWSLSIRLRKHLKTLRAHEYKAKGSRTRVAVDYSFPATRFKRQEELSFGDVEGVGTQTTDWTSANCYVRSRRLRLTTP